MSARVPAALLAVLLAASTAGFGADRDFDRLVNAIESHYSIHRTHIPLMGVANFALKIVHPGGAHGLRLAVFQDLESCDACFDPAEVDRFMSQAAEGDLRPLVRAHSKGEATYILTGQIGKTTKMLIATFGRSEATVVEVTVDIETLLRTVGAPGKARDWLQ